MLLKFVMRFDFTEVVFLIITIDNYFLITKCMLEQYPTLKVHKITKNEVVFVQPLSISK